MTQSTKLAAGAPFPAVSVPRFGGGEIAPVMMEGWRLLVVYRGKHYPLCKSYLNTLDSLLEEFAAAGVSIAAISSGAMAETG
jgi:peroxiredoxin